MHHNWYQMFMLSHNVKSNAQAFNVSPHMIVRTSQLHSCPSMKSLHSLILIPADYVQECCPLSIIEIALFALHVLADLQPTIFMPAKSN